MWCNDMWWWLVNIVHYYTLPELLSYNIPHYQQRRDWKVETMNKPVYRLYTVLQKCTLGHISQYGCILLLQTDGSVFLSLCVGHTGKPCKNSWSNQNAVLGQTRVGPGNHVLDGGWTLSPCGKYNWSILWPYVKLHWQLVHFVTQDKIVKYKYKSTTSTKVD